MTVQQALKEAKKLYTELAGKPSFPGELPTQADRVMAIVEIARFLIKHTNAINP